MIRRLAAAVAIVGLLGASAVQAHDAERQAELLDELLRLNSEGIPEHIIIKQVHAWCFRFELDGDDIIELHTLGVSDDVIETLIDTGFQDLECEDDDYEYVWYRGAYSPWWYVPYAWGWYWWDPWPTYYVHHYYYPYSYYPCHYGYGYGYGHHGYYGWHGSDYYVAYNPRTRVAPPRERSGLTVLSGVPAAPAGAGLVTQAPRSRGVVVPNQNQASERRQVPGQGHIDARRSPQLSTRSGAGAAEVTRPRSTGASGTEQPRLTPAKRVESPAAMPTQPSAQPRSSPRLEPVASGSERRRPAVQRPNRTPPPSADRVESRRSGRQRVAPSQPAKRVERGRNSRPRRSTVKTPSRSKQPGVKTPSRSKRASVKSPSRSKRSTLKSPSRSKRSSVKTSPPSKRSTVKAPTRSNRSISRSRPSRSITSRGLSRPSGRSTASKPRGRVSGSRGRSR